MLVVVLAGLVDVVLVVAGAEVELVVLGACVVVVVCAVVEVVVDAGAVVDVLVGPPAQPAFRTSTLQLAWSRPSFTATLLTCAAQLTYAP